VSGDKQVRQLTRSACRAVKFLLHMDTLQQVTISVHLLGADTQDLVLTWTRSPATSGGELAHGQFCSNFHDHCVSGPPNIDAITDNVTDKKNIEFLKWNIYSEVTVGNPRSKQQKK
jgi:hypothetical protein